MFAAALLLLTAVLLDALIGDPVYPLHPVRLMGKAITAAEKVLRRMGLSGLMGGVLLLFFLLAFFCGGTYFFLAVIVEAGWPLAAIFGTFILYSSIALTDMFRHTKPVANALRREDLDLARQEVQKIVGRDVHLLDEEGVARAAVESIAEGFVDGFLSPLFWFSGGAVAAAFAGTDPCVLGVAAAVGFRVTNTLDSMVGYHNERYQRFGSASARLDDILNFIPARLAIPVLVLAAFFTDMQAGNCWRIGIRDRLKHASPNAGHAESCVAGALGIRLGGPTIYPHGTIDKPWLGERSSAVDASSIERSCVLIRAGGWISVVLLLIALLTLYFAGF